MRHIKRAAIAALATCSLGLGMAGPAAAQNTQEGLVNVALEDVVVQLPIGIAANVCDVNVAALAELADTAAPCDATAASAASAGPSGNGNTRQEGLVNVLVQDVVVQVPVALAANICDVNVAILAEVTDESAACNADADADGVVDSNTPGGGGGGAMAPFDAVPLDPASMIRLDDDLNTDVGLPL